MLDLVDLKEMPGIHSARCKWRPVRQIALALLIVSFLCGLPKFEYHRIPLKGSKFSKQKTLFSGKKSDEAAKIMWRENMTEIGNAERFRNAPYTVQHSPTPIGISSVPKTTFSSVEGAQSRVKLPPMKTKMQMHRVCEGKLIPGKGRNSFIGVHTPISIHKYLPANHTFLKPNGTADKEINLQYLASALHEQIEALSASNCTATLSLLCGHFDKCGLGCQLHHRATCLMLSYSMGLPLIHDSSVGWPFDLRWESIYQPLGAKCSVNDKTVAVVWRFNETQLNYKIGTSELKVKYPFKKGVPVDRELLRILEENHPKPFMWFVGQFLKHASRLSHSMEKSVQMLKDTFSATPSAGLHVRRTDKIFEDKGFHHDITEYIKAAEAFASSQSNGTLNIYLASDDHTLLSEARMKFPLPRYKIMGQELNQTFSNQKMRGSSLALRSIVTDISLLSQCDYIVCDFSSNVCRLIFELLSADRYDASKRVKSIGSSYKYLLAGHVVPEKLIPYDGNCPQDI